MKDLEINRTFWELEHLSNSSDSAQNRIAFKDALVGELLVKAHITSSVVFTTRNFIEKHFDHANVKILVNPAKNFSGNKTDFLPLYIAPIVDEQSFNQAIKHNYIKMMQEHKKSFVFSLVNFLPLSMKDNDKNNDWLKKISDEKEQKKLKEWLEHDKVVLVKDMLEVQLNNFLEESNITNNFDYPLLFITNVDLNQNYEVTENIYIYWATIDVQTKKVRWLLAPRDLFGQRKELRVQLSHSIDPKDINLQDLMVAKNTELKDHSFIVYAHEDNSHDHHPDLFAFNKNDYIPSKPDALLLDHDKLMKIEDKKVPDFVKEYYKYFLNLMNKD